MNIQSLWIGTSLSIIEQLCIKSFQYYGHTFTLYTYNDIESVPEGTIVKDANEILAEEFIFTSHNGSVAHFADWFRWTLLYKKGGAWVDMDLIALRPFDFKHEIVFGDEIYGSPAIGMLKFPKGHFLTKYMADICKKPNMILKYDPFRTRVKKVLRMLSGNNRNRIGWGEAGGPVGFRKALLHFDLMKYSEPVYAFYPIEDRAWQVIFDDTYKSYPSMLCKESYAIHLWNEHIRRDSSFTINTYDKNSLFSYLLEKYGLV